MRPYILDSITRREKEVCRDKLRCASSAACLSRAAHLRSLQGSNSNGVAGIRLQCGLDHRCSTHVTVAKPLPVTHKSPLWMH